MFRTTLIATAALAAATFAAAPNAAQAGVDFHIGVGVPGVVYGTPGYYRAPGYYHAPRRAYRLSCGQARHAVRRHGYHHIRALDCRGSGYKFKARRGGHWWIIKVRSRSGRIYAAYPI